MTKPLLYIVTLLLVTIAASSQVDTKSPKDTTLVRLKKTAPGVKWNLESATSLDIDCDGKPDTMLWGIDEHAPDHIRSHPGTRREVVLGFDFGSAAKPQTLNIPFRKDTGYYGFRADPKTIEVKPISCDWEGSHLPGCASDDRCQSLWIKDGEGGEFYVYWDWARMNVGWVRH